MALTLPVDNLLLERELIQVCTPGGQGSRMPTEVGFALVNPASEMRFPLWIEKWNGCTIGKWGDFL